MQIVISDSEVKDKLIQFLSKNRIEYGSIQTNMYDSIWKLKENQVIPHETTFMIDNLHIDKIRAEFPLIRIIP